MFRHSILCTVSLLAMCGAAQAAPATREGAEHLTKVFQAYLGALPGTVTVTPEGETYVLKVDAAPLVDKFMEGAATAQIAPLTYTLTDNGDSTWRVTEDQPLNVKIEAPGTINVTYTADRMVSDGIWDERLPGFVSQTATITNLGSESTNFGPEGEQLSTSSQLTEEMTFDTTGVAAAEGAIDIAMDYKATGITQSTTIQKAEQPLTITMTAARYEGDLNVAGFRSRDTLSLLAWIVAHPMENLSDDAKVELRSVAATALPGFETLDATVLASDIVATTPFGDFGATEFSVKMDANGLVSNGRVHQTMGLKGLTVPEVLVPEWARGLVPSDISLGLTASGFDLDASVRYLLANDAATLDTPESNDKLGKLFFPNGVVDFALSEGELKNSLYDLTFDGQIKAGPGVDPVGTATVSAVGMDKVQAELSKAPPEIAGQIMMPLAMALGMAKNEGGKLIWEIDGSTPGSVLINGIDVSAMAP